MSRVQQSITEAVFLGRLRRYPEIDRTFYVECQGVDVPLLVRKRASPVLIVTFAGALRRYPQFGAKHLHRYVSASVIGIADPSPGVLNELKAAWYAGHPGFAAQTILLELIHKMARACGAKRIILLGQSVGGFAALYYSWMIPGSVCVALNPQTRLDAYSFADHYRRIAWPELDPSEPLSRVIVSDLTSCYAERFENTVIYLQASQDDRHVRDHFGPFLTAVERRNQRHLIARLGYWGREGHGQVPAHAWLPWVSAAITASTTRAVDIQKERREYDVRSEQEPSPQDFDLADKLVARSRTELVGGQ